MVFWMLNPCRKGRAAFLRRHQPRPFFHRENDRCRAKWPLWLAVSASRQCFPVIVDPQEIAEAPLPHQHSSGVSRT